MDKIEQWSIQNLGSAKNAKLLYKDDLASSLKLKPQTTFS